MILQDKLSVITQELDKVWDRYKEHPKFYHPIFLDRSPLKQEWPDKYPGEESFFWRVIYDVGRYKDTSGFILKYYPEKEIYNVGFGKVYDGINDTTKDMEYVLELFELFIEAHIIGKRPKNFYFFDKIEDLR